MNCKKRHLLNLLLLLAPGIGPATASPYASLPANECDVANAPLATNACSSLVGVNRAIGSNATGNGVNYVGARSLSLTTADTAIHAYGYCFYVDNQSTISVFVPFNSSIELTSFMNDLPPAINLIDCSVPGQVMVPPNFPGVPQANQCMSNPPSLPVNVPNYAPYATAASATATYTGSPATPFTCMSSDGTSFTETATATFGQQDSYDPVVQVGWTTSVVVYTYNGVCGSANGVPSINAPATDLCHVGIALNAPTQDASGNWTWTCYGGNGPNSQNASCASAIPAGQCNKATTNTPTTTAPASGSLCSAGTPSSVGGGSGSPWTWTCSQDGETTDCSAPYAATPIDGQCNAATEATTTTTAPTGKLCTAGTASSLGGGSGSAWTWSCDGSGGGTNTSCSAPYGGASCTVGTLTYADGATWTRSYPHTCSTSGQTHTIDTYTCKNGTTVLVSSVRSGHCNASCFPPDTPVLTADRGWQPISQIKRGDVVVSFDAKGNKTTAEVKNIKITLDQPIRVVNGSIRLSHSQEAQVATGAWKDAKDLKLGEALVDTEGKPQPIVSLADEPEKITVYNLIMADHDIPFFAAGVRVKDWKGTDPEWRQ